jgi:hypothetical protein
LWGKRFACQIESAAGKAPARQFIRRPRRDNVALAPFA